MGGGGGKSGSSQIVGYKYLMGAQLAVCYGPVDSVNKIIVGEREAWSGLVTENATIIINKPELFGGDSREGGVVGDVDVLMGSPTQARSPYLATWQGEKCPAYRGILSILFKSFQWSSGNPYFKAPWIEVTRILAGWKGGTWNPGDAVINTLDMNPAHIIYQCLTDSAWGMGYSVGDIDDASFRAAATALKAEGFGISIPWDQQSTVEDFIKIIISHVNGAVALDLTTGKFKLRLIRDDYNHADLLDLNESNILEMKSFQRAAFGEAANEVIITYTDRSGENATIAVQNLASIAVQGGVISSAKSYPGIRDATLAARVGLRDLATLASPLAQVVIVCNRVMWSKEIGDVVKITWPTLGLDGVAFRVMAIPKGTLTDSKITVTLVEDIFGLPHTSYTAVPMTQWVDNVVPPIAADAAFAVEAPYWEVVRSVSLANQAQLQPGYGFGMFAAARGAVQSPISYILSASADNVQYHDVATGHFSPTGRLASSISPTATAISISGAFDLTEVVLSEDGGYAYIDDECVSVISVDPESGAAVIGRGVLDTVPVNHSVGARVWFITPSAAHDQSERIDGETVYYKPRPTTGLGSLALADANVVALTLHDRASRPYPPGNFKVDGVAYPTTIPGPNVQSTWSHRDRIAQTVDLVDSTAGNIGPEPGITYLMRVYNGETLLRSYPIDGSTTSWSYPSDHDVADGRIATLRLALSAVRNGLESKQAQSHTFTRLVGVGGVFVSGPPAAPILSSGPAPFSIVLTWLFGDARSNLLYTEIRVSETPMFEDSTVLHYADYPVNTYTHEIAEIGAFRWYWARTADNGGLLSPWSNITFSRASRSDPAQVIADLEGKIAESMLIPTLRSRIDLVDTPATGLVARAAALSSAIDTINATLADIAATPAYDPTITYPVDFLVTYQGSLYQAKLQTLNHLPTDTTYWLKVGEYASIGDAVAGQSVVLSEHGTRITTTETAITAEATARTTLASRVTSAESALATNSAAVTTEASTRAAADLTEANSRTTLATQMRGTYTGGVLASLTSGLLYSEVNARSTADSALATRASQLEATVNTPTSGLVARITSEESARATGDAANASAITALSTSVSNVVGDTSAALASAAAANTSAASAVTTANAAQVAAAAAINSIADIAADSKLTPVEKSAVRAEWDVIAAEKAGINAQATTFSITTQNTTYNSSFQALANYLNASAVWSSGIPSWITDAALATTTVIVGATFRSTFKAYYDARTALLNAITLKAKTIADAAQLLAAGTSAAITTEANTRATADSANATAITTLTTTVGNNTSSIQTQASTINGLSAQYTIKVDVNGHVAGYGLASSVVNGVPLSEFAVVADRFTVSTPSGTKTPFAVVNTGGDVFKILMSADVVISGDLLVAGSIQSSALATGVVTADKIAAGTITGNKIAASTITADKINGNGLKITGNGEFAGTLTAASGTFTGKVNGGEFNTGAYAGYGWPAAGGTGVHISVNGILIGNPNGGKYFQVYTPPGDWANAAIYTNIPAYIEDASIGTLKIAGEAITVPRSASGTTSAATPYADFGGSKITVVAQAVVSANDMNTGSATLYRNGVAIPGAFKGYSGPSSTYSKTQLVFVIIDSPGPGAWSYSIAGGRIQECSIVVIGTKR